MEIPYLCVVKHGNAVVPYSTVVERPFHTEFAARLFGKMSCEAALYRHWTVRDLSGGGRCAHAGAPIHATPTLAVK
jgi:hypothetical protein